MISFRTPLGRCFAPSSAAVILVLGIALSAPTFAADLLGLYAGAGVGQAQIQADNLPNPDTAIGGPPSIGNFKENHSAYKFLLGLRPISLVGAEIEYLDFGHPSGTVGTIPLASLPLIIPVPVSADVTTKGTAAFGILYLPVPIVDIYVKAGIARLQTTENATITLPAPYATCVIAGGPNCQFSKRYELTDTGLAVGAGAQLKFGSLAVRGEYERFSAAGANPSLYSLALTWTFL